MKAKNIMMSLLLVMGAIAAKASGYPPELALVSQPVMVYNYSSITVYYDVENIGDYTYRGYVNLYLDPDYGYSYAEKYVRVRPGSIKRVAIEIPTYKIHRGHRFTIMPYYELGDDLYSFTIFEYFEPISFYLDGPRNERWVVINVPPRPRVYHRPGTYRYYYDGYRPPMPPLGHGPGTPPPPMDPHHHTYGYHHSNGGYPATHNEFNDHPSPAPSATVRPNDNTGSMSSGGHNSGSNVAPTPNSEGSSSSGSVRPNNSGSSSSTARPSGTNGSTSGRVSGSSSSGSNTARPSNSGSSSGRVSGSSSSSRHNSTSGSSSGRVSNSSSSRSSGTSGSSSTRTSSTSNTRSSGTSTSSSRSGSSSTRSSSSSSSSRSGGSTTGSGRR